MENKTFLGVAAKSERRHRDLSDLRIVLLGKTGEGKSSCGNTILGEKVFSTGNSPNSLTHKCKSKTKSIREREITVVDVPGLFDTSVPQEELNAEVIKSITCCAPGPHAFGIVLRVGRYTEYEKETLRKITALFGEEALKHTVVLFSHGDQLSEGQKIEDFVVQNSELQEFVNKCGGRVHVFDNKYWNQQKEGYRSNRVQVENLLNTIEEMVRENGGKYYTNEMLQSVNRAIEKEYECIRNENIRNKGIILWQNMREEARKRVHTRLCVRLVGMGTGIIVGALLGFVTSAFVFRLLFTPLIGDSGAEQAVIPPTASTVAATAASIASSPVAYPGASKAVSRVVSTVVSPVGCTAAKIVVGATTLVGGVGGAIIGYEAVEGAETMTDAMKLAAKATYETAADIASMISTKNQTFKNHHD